MIDDIKKNNQLIKSNTSSLQKRASNIVSRGLADLALLDVDSNVLNYVNKIKYSEDWDERQSAWLELRKMGPTYKGWVTSLVDLIYNSDGWGRIFAAESLSQFKEAANDAVPLLDSLLEVSLNQEDTLWARIAAGSLGKYDANSSEMIADAIPTLIKALECSDYNVREYAAKALANWGQLSKSAIVKLAELTNNEDEERLLQAHEWVKKGYDYYANTEYDKAIEAFTKAIALDPNLADAYRNRGNIYTEKGQYDRAIENYNMAVVLDPNFAPAYTHRGFAYGNKGLYDRAIEDFNKAIALNPNNGYAYSCRGVAYNGKKQYNMAIEDYNKAIALEPNDAVTYTNCGNTYSNKGQYDRAIEYYNKAVALDPKNTSAYNNRGIAYEMNGAIDKAISDFQKACDLGNEKGCENLQRVLKQN